MDVNNAKPAVENKPLRIWKTWETIVATGVVVLMSAFMTSLVVSRPNAPKGADGRPPPIFMEIFFPSTVKDGHDAYEQSLVRKKNEAYRTMVKNAQDMLQAKQDSTTRANNAQKKNKKNKKHTSLLNKNGKEMTSIAFNAMGKNLPPKTFVVPMVVRKVA